MLSRIILPVATLVLCLGPVLAQGTGTLSGVAMTASGPCGANPPPGQRCVTAEEPVANLELLIKSDAGSHAFEAHTGADGRFALKLTPGRYRIELRNQGFHQTMAPQWAEIHDGRETSVRLKIELLRP